MKSSSNTFEAESSVEDSKSVLDFILSATMTEAYDLTLACSSLSRRAVFSLCNWCLFSCFKVALNSTARCSCKAARSGNLSSLVLLILLTITLFFVTLMLFTFVRS